jgi:conjugal transfer ATP-binding protein TraC
MSANAQYAQQLFRQNISSLFSPISYDDASRMFYTSDSHIAFGWISNPITGASEATADKLNMLLSMQYPPGSIMSFSMWASPDIDGYISELMELRAKSDFGGHPVLKQAIKEKSEFLRAGTTKKLNDRVYGILRDVVVMVTLKIPATKGALPSDKDWRVAGDLRTSVEKSLEGIGLRPYCMDQQVYLHVLGTILNWGNMPSWRNGGPPYDAKTLLNEQVVDYDTDIKISEGGLTLGNKHVRVLSPKRYPDFVNLPAMHLMVGDVKHGKDGIAGNFLSTMNIVFPDAVDEKAKQDGKRTVVNYQAMGPVAALNSALRQKKTDYDVLFAGVDNGDRILKMQHTFVVFADDDESATQAVAGMISYYRDMHFHVQDDKYISLPLFINALPLGADTSPKAISFFSRYRTCGSSQASNLAPIVSDWKGTSRPVLTYISRNQQIMSLDLFESSSNFNFIVAAQSGAGKSFWANDLLVSYLSTGAKCYVIDVGRSYLKICNILDGQFLLFSKDSALCLNPFELVKDFEEEGSMLTDMIKAMAAPTTKLGDWETSAVQKCISTLWERLGNSMTVDDVAAALLEHEDTRARDIGDQLFAFTSKGEYGRWFVGKNNVRFDKNLTVLELEELKGKPHLQVIVLLQLIYQITQDLYLGDRSIPKLILVDESWDLFNKGDIAAFMIAAYRRARKYGGGIGIITQSISDLYANETVGLPMLENSAWMFLLGQKGESVDFMQKTGRLSLSDGGFQLLKTVQTVRGRFSEIFIYTSSYNGSVAAGIGRLVVSRFSQLLYTTDARELSAIKVYTDQGMALTDAMHAVIRDEQSNREH